MASRRDFIYGGGRCKANIYLAEHGSHEIYNVAGGSAITVNRLFEIISGIIGSSSEPEYLDERPGDVKHSHADTSRLRGEGFTPEVGLEEGLQRTVEWFMKHM